MPKHRAAELDADARGDLAAGDFAVPEIRQLRIHDAVHARAAMARFNQTHFPDAEAKAKRRILAATKRFDIEVGECSAVSDVTADEFGESPEAPRLRKRLRKLGITPRLSSWVPNETRSGLET